MEEILSQAKEKGLFVVNSEDSSETQLLSEFTQVTAEADRLCEVVDPEDKPFDSKYKARDLLDEFLKKLEANQAIAQLEKKADFILFLKRCIASVQTRIGSISFDCEEPHNAQNELEAACRYYFPELIDYIDSTIGNRDELLTSPNTTLDAAHEAETVTAPDLPLLLPITLLDGVKCLNLLGILWAGRGHPLKSLYYLLAANACFHQNQSPFEAHRKEFENLFTHNLFYLAQAYGNLKCMKQSSQYCHQTLQRQLRFGLVDLKSALDWVKNCCGIADYFLAIRHYHTCSYALLSAEKVLKEKVIQTLYVEMEKDLLESSEKEVTSSTNNTDKTTPGSKSNTTLPKPHQRPNFVQGNLNAAEIEADLHRRFAVLDGQVLRLASERFQQRETALSLALSESDLATIDEEYLQPEDEARRATTTRNNNQEVAFFEDLWISELSYLSIPSINSFEAARTVFLRAASRIESAKKYYVLDGYVTDHVTLLQEHSKLFHSLHRFERDSKRKLAMESRRLEMLYPVLKSLNLISFEVLHKQVSYELGETALGLLDLKLDKLKDGRQGLDEKALKKSEIMKCNDYARQALVCFAHFSYLYAQAKDRKSEHTLTLFETLPLYELAEQYCVEPDESLISEEEVRPFLNANFLSCRVLSKIIPHPSSLPSSSNTSNNNSNSNNPRGRAVFLIASLHRYQWLTEFIPKICHKRGLEIAAIYGEEYQICRDMVKLLPSKIDRMCYLGESGLSL